MPIRPPIEDVTTIRPKRCRRYRGAQRIKCTSQIGVHQLVPDLVGHLFQGSGADDPGVGHQNVETSQSVDRLLHGRTDRGGVAHIDGDRNADTAQRLDLLGRIAKIGLGAEWIRQTHHRTGCIGNDDVCTFSRQRQGMRAPLPPTPSSNKRDPTIQHTHRRPP
jgi:hypothetical protein